MLSKHDTMHSFSIYEHLFNILSLDDVLINQRRLVALNVVQIRLCHDLLSLGQSPELAVL